MKEDNFDMLANGVRDAIAQYLLHGSTYASLSTDILTSENNDLGVETVYLLVVNKNSYECLSKILPVLHHDVTRRIFYDVLHETVTRLENNDDLLDNLGDV